MPTRTARPSSYGRATVVHLSALVIATVILLATASNATVITTPHDPNQNAIAGASTTSECTGFFTVTIKYTITNETMENQYTIDWKTVPFRITNVAPGQSRSTSISSTFFYSCPEVPGAVDWIDDGPTAPALGTQTFPAPHHKLGFVTLEVLNQVLSFNSTYSIEDTPVLAMVNTAEPLDPGALDGLWAYSSAVTNLDTVAHSFSNTLFTSFLGTVDPGQTAEFTVNAPRPFALASGALSILDTGDVFPVAGFQAIPEPSTLALLGLGAATLGIRRRFQRG